MKWNLECLKATSSKKKPRNRYYKCFQNLYVNGLLIKKKKKKKAIIIPLKIALTNMI